MLLLRARIRLLVAVLLGAAVFTTLQVLTTTLIAVTGAWIAVAGAYGAVTWHRIRRMDAAQTRRHAVADDPGRRGAHLLLITASVASLVGVGALLVAGSGKGDVVPVEALVGMASVATSWTLVHLIYTLRYASVFFADEESTPVGFSQTTHPDYQDFAYLAFTLGMTYQVSDTDLNTQRIRRLALRHAVLSYLLGVVVVASTINLVVQLASSTSSGG